MRDWWLANWGNILVLGILALIVGLIFFCTVRARKTGKGGCAHGCGGCAMQGICHEKKGTKT